MKMVDHITDSNVVKYLKQQLRFKPIADAVLYQQVVEDLARASGIVVTEEELQAEADRQRHDRKLYRAADTIAWLAQEWIEPDDWEAGIYAQLLVDKVAETLFGDRVEEFFIERRRDFDRVAFYQIIVPYEKLARELYYQISEDEISFYEAAHLYDLDRDRRSRCGYEGEHHRYELMPALAAVAFNQPLGIAGQPFKTEIGHHLLLVADRQPAELTPDRRRELLRQLLHDRIDRDLQSQRLATS